MNGNADLVRFADDFIITFSNEADAHRVREVPPNRFERFRLAIQEANTRLVDFSRPGGKGKKPGSFDLLGFTHYWGKSGKGNWVVQRKTAKKKFKEAVRRMCQWCKENRHMPVKEQWETLNRKVQGDYGYYVVTFNMRGVKGFHEQVKRAWHKLLNRRSRDKDMPWECFNRLSERYPLPAPRIVHHYS